MDGQRAHREDETREEEARPDDTWIPQSVLPVPREIDGWVFRWIRTGTHGHEDNTNVSQKFREGWIPVKSDDHPEIKQMSDVNSRFEGNVEVGGLLLCKAPTQKMAARSKHYEGVANAQIEGVDGNFMRENDPRMPLLKPDRQSRTQFRSG
jgi:hypothetical protein